MSEQTKVNGTGKTTFESQLVRYALAGGALLGVPVLADAEIIYSGANQNVPFTSISPAAINFNPLVDLIPDVTFSVSAVGPDTGYTATPGASNALNVGPLSGGQAITMANTTTTTATEIQHVKFPGTFSGPWAAQGTNPAYLGVRFTASGQDYLGWVQVQLNGINANGTVIDWAYENTPETSILAGATAPEPSSLALFALGAAGVLALRRRRQAS